MPYARSPIITMQDAAGNVLASGSVQVTNEATGGSAALYSDRNGTSLANPFTAETDGSFPFYAAGGRYRIDVTVGAETYTVRDVPIGLLQEQDTVALVGKRIAVRAATTANITIATALNNGDVIDGVTLATNDLVLVKNQTAPAENAIIVVGVTPARHSEFDTYDDHVGAVVSVSEGTVNASRQYFCSANTGGVLGTTAIDFTQIIATVGATGATGATGAGGATGSTGADGTDPGILLTFDTDTVDADQGAGKIWADNANLSAAAVVFISKTNRNGSSIATRLAEIDDSTNAHKGVLSLTNSADGKQASWRAGAVTDATNYVKVAVSSHSGETSFAAAAAISLQPNRTGDAGDVTAAAPYTATNQIVVATGAGKDTKDTPATVSDAGVITGTSDDVDHDGVTRTVIAKHSASGSPEPDAGIGVGYEWQVETGGGVHTVGAIDYVLTDVADGSEDADVVGYGIIAGTLTELWRITSAGVFTLLANALKRVLTADGGMTLGGGFIATSYNGHGTAGVVSSGTVTPAPGAAQGNIQHYTNGGAHTLAPPANPCTVAIEITNNASAGAITTSGFSVVEGSFNTTNAKKFLASIVKTATVSLLNIRAMN